MDTTNQGTRLVSNLLAPHLKRANRTVASIPEDQHGLYEEVDRLRLEVERLRDQQQTLQRTSQSNDTHVDDDAKDQESDYSNTKEPTGRGRVLRRRALRVMMALVVTALLCAGGLLFWNQLKSYEWWTDAQIGGLVRSLETQ
jgi:hypothetical protein